MLLPYFSFYSSTVSKILRRKEKFLYSNDDSQSPAKKAKGKFKQKNNPLGVKIGKYISSQPGWILNTG
jgi:hypothetical protein